MSDSETLDYLQPGFDPSSLTNPRLRSILVTYNVHYASNAKKPELIHLFNTHVAPQASKIIARRARAKRTSMGIVDATNVLSQSTNFDDDEEEEEEEEHPKPAKRVGRKPRVKHEEEETQSRQTRRTSPRKRSTRSTSRLSATPQPQPAASDTDTGDDNAASLLRPTSSYSRRTRSRTPQVKLEAAEEEEDTLVATPRPQTSSFSLPVARRTPSGTTDDEENESVFTDDNPFQSGSSPLAPPSATTSTRRRTVEPRSSHKRVSSGSSTGTSRRRTHATVTPSPAGPSFDFLTPRAAKREPSRSPSISVQSPSPEPETLVDDSFLEPGEEFTPEEQLELAQEEALNRLANADANRNNNSNSNSNKNVVASPSTTRSRTLASALATPLLVLVLTLVGVYGAWYRQEKLAVGFCGLGRPAQPLLASRTFDLTWEWLPDAVLDKVDTYVHLPSEFSLPATSSWPESLQIFIEPQCEPCPQHAFCYSDYTVSCESGYLAKPHPFALGGLLPLPPTCEPDGERARRVKAVADRAVEELRDRRAQYECGESVDAATGEPVASPSMEEPELKETIAAKRSKKMSKDEFDDLWAAALGDIEARDEVEVEKEQVYPTPDSGAIQSTRLSSSSLARLPLTCAVRRSIRLGIARFRFPLFLLASLIAAFFYLRFRLRSRRAMLAQVPELVDVVLARLAAQKATYLYEEEGGVGGEALESDQDAEDAFLFLPQLRDDVLRSEHALAAREKLWKYVIPVVEQNSNVRTGQRTGRNGEVGRAWEWIGPVGSTAVAAVAAGVSVGSGMSSEFGSAIRRRRSGRMSSVGPPGAARTPRESSVDVGSGVNNDLAIGEPPDAQNRSALHRRWQESRPIY